MIKKKLLDESDVGFVFNDIKVITLLWKKIKKGKFSLNSMYYNILIQFYYTNKKIK